MKVKKYNELRTSKATEIKNSVDQAKVIEIQHYNEPIGYLVSKSEFERRAEKLKENS